MKLGLKPILLVIAAALGVLVYLDYTAPREGAVEAVRRPPQTPEANPGSKSAATPGQVSTRSSTPDLGRHPLADLRLDDLGSTIARPLFEVARRPVERPVPPPAPPPPAPVAAAPPPAKVETVTLRLVGVIASDAQRTAILARPGAASVRVEQGDFVDGWEVVAIAPTEVTLTRDGRRVALKFQRKAN